MIVLFYYTTTKMGSNISHNYYITKDELREIESHEQSLCDHEYTPCPTLPNALRGRKPTHLKLVDREVEKYRMVKIPVLTDFAVRMPVGTIKKFDTDSITELNPCEYVYAIIYTRIGKEYRMTVEILPNDSPVLIHYTALAGVQNVNTHFDNYESNLMDRPVFDLNSYKPTLRNAGNGDSIVLRVTNQLYPFWGMKSTHVQYQTSKRPTYVMLSDFIYEQYPTNTKSKYIGTRRADHCSVYHVKRIGPPSLLIYHVYRLDYRDVRNGSKDEDGVVAEENIKRVLDYRL